MWKGESAAGLAVWTQGEALYNAVDKRRVEDVKRLLGQGQDPNDDAMRGHGEEQWTPLHRAAAHGHEEMIDALLRAGADVNAFNQRQSTPLHLAAWSGHTLTVRQLLLAGADPAIKTNRNETAREVAVKMGHTDVMRAVDEHYAFLKARVNADHSRAKEEADRKRAINTACRLARESLAKGDAAWATQVIERGLLNDENNPELLELLHKAEVQTLVERTFKAEETLKLRDERCAEVEARLERTQAKVRDQTAQLAEMEESERAAKHAERQAVLLEEKTRLALQEAETRIAALRGDRSQGRVKVQARWGERGQWISFKTTRDIEIAPLQAKLAGALHVSAEELQTMDLQWRDDDKNWWRVVDESDLAEALEPPAVDATGSLTERELVEVVRNNKADKPVLLQLLPVLIQPDAASLLEARVVELQEQVSTLRAARPGSASGRRGPDTSRGDADPPKTPTLSSRPSSATFTRPLYEQVAAAIFIQKIARGRGCRVRAKREGSHQSE